MHALLHARGAASLPRGNRSAKAHSAPGRDAPRHPKTQSQRSAWSGEHSGQAHGQGPRPALSDTRTIGPRSVDVGRSAGTPLGKSRKRNMVPAWQPTAALGTPSGLGPAPRGVRPLVHRAALVDPGAFERVLVQGRPA